MESKQTETTTQPDFHEQARQLEESEEFYNLMQTYRHASVIHQDAVVMAYEAVKTFIASFAVEAATQGQACGIERTAKLAKESFDRYVEMFLKSDGSDYVNGQMDGMQQAAQAIYFAIGQLSPDPSYLDRVRNEARAALLAELSDSATEIDEKFMDDLACGFIPSNQRHAFYSHVFGHLEQRLAAVAYKAATAALEQAAQWQPIESAPKDGRAILVGRERNSPQSVRWMISVDKQSPGGWWFVGGYDGHRLRWEPSHWMPLPQPPKETTRNENDTR